MEKKKNKNYLRNLNGSYGALRSLLLVLLVFFATVAVSFVSPVDLGGVKFRRANLYPDFLEYDDELQTDGFVPDFESLYNEISSAPASDTSVTVTFFAGCDSVRTDGVLRVAFFGDSFIEGDILTKDLRESLQKKYGGRGIGFVPCRLPFAIYRQTAKVSGEGWQRYGIMKYKSVPDKWKGSFLASGYMDAGGAGAQMLWEQFPASSSPDSTAICRIIFLSPSESRVEAEAGGDGPYRFDVEGSPLLRQIVIRTDSDRIAFRVLSGEVLCYGASFESEGGVIVDNFSVRSNSGNAIFNSSAALNRQFCEMMGYDLAVLQYGLNVMQPDKRNYANYQKQLENVIRYVKAGFPGSRIAVMGVSDRGVLRDGDTVITSINSADALTRCQRAAAAGQDALFWDTYAAMNSLGGLRKFVENGWMASDQVHFTFKGGRVIAAGMSPFIENQLLEIKRSRRKTEILDSIEPVPGMRAEAVCANPSGVIATGSPEAVHGGKN